MGWLTARGLVWETEVAPTPKMLQPTITARRSIIDAATMVTIRGRFENDLPHTHGARLIASQTPEPICGPSPRAWGSDHRGHDPPQAERSIPTCVGLRFSNLSRERTAAVHPHVRGAQRPDQGVGLRCAGPSPRAWGSVVSGRRGLVGGRSIPTCVGLRTGSRGSLTTGAVHPHVRGAQPDCEKISWSGSGPSPRAWGSGPGGRRPAGGDRSIPTCVGLRARRRSGRAIQPVHPHVRGAQTHARHARIVPGGPSPRAWGSAARSSGRRTRTRSIPTCVGLRCIHGRRIDRRPVHPHVRGAQPVPAPDQEGQGRSIPTCVGLRCPAG